MHVLAVAAVFLVVGGVAWIATQLKPQHLAKTELSDAVDIKPAVVPLVMAYLGQMHAMPSIANQEGDLPVVPPGPDTSGAPIAAVFMFQASQAGFDIWVPASALDKELLPFIAKVWLPVQGQPTPNYRRLLRANPTASRAVA